MISLTTKRITKENFQDYGKLVTRSFSQPTSQGQTYRFWSDLAHYYIEGETEIGWCTVYKQKENIITGLERHLHTPEILIPIDAGFALPLLKDDDSPGQAVCLHVEIGQAVVIDQAVWHGACIPVLVPESSYFVIFKRATPGTDVEMKEIEPLTIEL